MKTTNFSNIVLLNADEFNAKNNINEYDSVVASNSLANYGFVAINTDTNDVVDDEDILEEIYESVKNCIISKNFNIDVRGLDYKEMQLRIDGVVADRGNQYQFGYNKYNCPNIFYRFKIRGLNDLFTAIFLEVVKYNKDGEERWLINIYGSKRGRSETLYHAKDIIPDGNYAFPFKEAKSAMEQTFGFSNENEPSVVNGFDNKEMHDKCLKEIEEYVYDISIEDVFYDRETGFLDIKCDNGFTIHLHPIDAWFSFEASEQNYTELQEALDLMNRYNDGAFDEFLPNADVA